MVCRGSGLSRCAGSGGRASLGRSRHTYASCASKAPLRRIRVRGRGGPISSYSGRGRVKSFRPSHTRVGRAPLPRGRPPARRHKRKEREGVYDQVTLSWMPRGLPATRHIARTLDTWQRQTVAGDEAGACRVPSCVPGVVVHARWTRHPPARLAPVSTPSRRRGVRPPVLLPRHLPLLNTLFVRRVRLLPLSLSPSLPLSPPWMRNPPPSTRNPHP